MLPKFHGYRRNGVNKRAFEDARCESVLNFFQMYITAAIINSFVVATNYYGNTFYSKYWTKDLDVAEFKAFIAVILEFGVITYPNRKWLLKTLLIGVNSSVV